MINLKNFTHGFAAVFASCMIMATGEALAASAVSSSNQHLPAAFITKPVGTQIKKDAATLTTNQSPTLSTNGRVNVTVHDHRHPERSQSAGTPPPSTKPPIPTFPDVRDHRPGGNSDPCLQDHNTCSAGDRNNSIIAFRKQHPDFIGLDGDPCFQTNSCTRTQLIESMIASAQKNLNRGWCDPRITGQGCAQWNTLPDGTEIILHYQRNYGPLTEADRQRLLKLLQEAYYKSLGGGGSSGGANTASRPN